MKKLMKGFIAPTSSRKEATSRAERQNGSSAGGAVKKLRAGSAALADPTPNHHATGENSYSYSGSYAKEQYADARKGMRKAQRTDARRRQHKFGLTRGGKL
eukprot:scaffold110479_cov35-Prasinocladus_malaysianus.AAC.1